MILARWISRNKNQGPIAAIMGITPTLIGGPGRCLTITAPWTKALEQTKNHRGHSIVLYYSMTPFVKHCESSTNLGQNLVKECIRCSTPPKPSRNGSQMLDCNLDCLKLIYIASYSSSSQTNRNAGAQGIITIIHGSIASKTVS